MHRLLDTAAREKFGKLWGASVPEKPGLAAGAMIDGAIAGTIKGLYVVGANPLKRYQASSSAPTSTNNDRFGKLDLLVVQDMFLTETARYADIVASGAMRV